MKKLSIILLGLFVSVLFFSGCGSVRSSSTAGGPGKVLGPPGGELDNHKVVTFFVIGKGLEPENAFSKGEAVLMAERAAVADGYRQLVEKVRGVYVDAFMRAGRGTVDYDTIQVHTQSWLRGTEIMEVSMGEYGITNVRLRKYSVIHLCHVISPKLFVNYSLCFIINYFNFSFCSHNMCSPILINPVRIKIKHSF